MCKRGLIAFILLILLLSSVVPYVHSDGTPIIRKELYLSTRENSQIAMIEVQENYEILHLFLSVTSLDPGENFTIAIPVRTAPENMGARNISESEFYKDYHLGDVEKDGAYSNSAWGNFTKLYSESTGIMSISQLIPFGFSIPLFMTVGYGGTGGASEKYEFSTGDSATVYNFTSAEDMKEFYKEMNLSLPQNVNQTIARYSGYHVIVLNVKTRAPIDSDSYKTLLENCPKTMELLREYVKKHSNVNITIMGYESYIYDISFPDDGEIIESLNNETGENYTLEQYFYRTVLSIYGYSNAKGLEITAKLPLFDGKAFYPLGTSPAWNSSGKIRVFFSIPEDKKFLSNNENYTYVNDYSRQFYFWNYDRKLPSHDLEGEIKNADANTYAMEQSSTMNVWLYHNYTWLAWLLAFLTLFFFWLIFYYLSIYLARMYFKVLGQKTRVDMNFQRMIRLGTLTFFMSYVLTAIGGAYFLFWKETEIKNPIPFPSIFLFVSLLSLQYAVSLVNAFDLDVLSLLLAFALPLLLLVVSAAFLRRGDHE